MTGHFAQSTEQLAQEIEFWRDYIYWWEQKNGKPAAGRVRAALAAAEDRRHAQGGKCLTRQDTAPAVKSDL